MLEPPLRSSAPVALIPLRAADRPAEARRATDCMAALVERGWQVVVAGSEVPSGLHDLGVTVLDLPQRAATRSARQGVTASTVAAALEQVRPDALYTVGVEEPQWAARARSARVPVVVHLQGGEMPGALRRALGFRANRVDRVVVRTRSDAAGVAAIVPAAASRTVVVPDPVPGPAQIAPIRTRTDGGFSVLLRCEKTSDPAVAAVLDALGRLDVEASLVVESTVADRSEVAGSGARNSRTSVTFTVRETDRWAAFAAADVIVTAPHVETRPDDPAIEAALIGRPAVVLTDVDRADALEGITSVICVSPDDPQTLAVALARIARFRTAFTRTAAAMAPIVASRTAPAAYRAAITGEIADVASRSQSSLFRTKEHA